MSYLILLLWKYRLGDIVLAYPDPHTRKCQSQDSKPELKTNKQIAPWYYAVKLTK